MNSPGTLGQEERLRRLLDVGRGLVSEFDLEAVLERVLEAARELTGARYAALGALDECREELERFITVGIDDETHRAIGGLPRGRGVLGVLISEPQPLRLAEVGAHPHSYGFPPGHPPMHSFLGVPILLRGEAYGNLYLTEKHGAFDSDDEEALLVLAEWAAIAIENARLFARAGPPGRAGAGGRRLRSHQRDLAGARGRDRPRPRARADRQTRACADRRAGDGRHARAGSELVVVALAGHLDNALLGERIPIEDSISGHVLRSGEPERLADASSRLRFALAKQTQAQTGLFVPLRFRGRVLGVLAGFDRLRDGPQFSRDEQLLSAFAASAAAAVATAQDVAAQALQRSIAAAEQERTRWARELHDETLQELAALKLLLATARIAKDAAERDVQLDLAVDRIDVAARALRNLITDLRPPVLDEYGLQPALEALVERMQVVSQLSVELQVALGDGSGGQIRLAPQVEDSVYWVVQEALANVVKHSGATRARVHVQEADGGVQLSVSDEGEGFAVEGEPSGFGLLGMRERLALVDGTISIESAAGAGTTVRASIPARGAFPSEDAAMADPA